MPPLMMAAHTQMAANRRSKGRTGVRMRSAPSRRNSLKYKGKVPGVYDDWEECRRQVLRFSGNIYKGYTTRAEAEVRYARYLAGERREGRRNQMKTTFIAVRLGYVRCLQRSLLSPAR